MVCHLRLSGFKGWSAHTVFWLTNTVRVHVALFDIVIVWQLNIRIGIPDKLMLLLGGAAVYHLLLTLSCMTTSLTVPRSCPRKLESTVYAISSGVPNLGSTCSTMQGAAAIELASIQMKETARGAATSTSFPTLFSSHSLFCLVHAFRAPTSCCQRRPSRHAAAPAEKQETASKGRSTDKSKTPCNPSQGIPTAEPPCGAASETPALQASVGGDKEV